MADAGNSPNHSWPPCASEVNPPLPIEGEVAPPPREHKKDKEDRERQSRRRVLSSTRAAWQWRATPTEGKGLLLKPQNPKDMREVIRPGWALDSYRKVILATPGKALTLTTTPTPSQHPEEMADPNLTPSSHTPRSTCFFPSVRHTQTIHGQGQEL